MRAILWCVLAVHVAAGAADAQTFGDVQVRIGAFAVTSDGGEKPVGVWYSTGPVVIAKPRTSTFSFGNTCEAFAVSGDGSVIDDATTAWRLEVTATRVVDDAVTFRLRWVRVTAIRQQLDRLSLDGDHERAAPVNDVQLTLRPGESWPIDTVQVPSGAKTPDGRPCGNAASIRASVDNYPWPENDRRLVAADLWLIERLPNGTEAPRSQPLSIRGLPNEPLRFYFDSIVDGNMSLEIYGTVLARLESGSLAVSVETRCRWGGSPDSRGVNGPQRSVRSQVQVKPTETVEIKLPALGERAGPFATRALSIRIQARQLR